jgi:hypothetical protein
MLELAYKMVSNTIAARLVGSNPTPGTEIYDFAPTNCSIASTEVRFDTDVVHL